MKKRLLFCFLTLIPVLLAAREDTVRLGDLLQLTLERNPKVKAAGLEARASSFRIPQAKSLPDPMVGFSLKNMGFPGFTLGREVMSGVGLSFSQAVPFPGKLRLKGEIAETASKRAQETRDAVVLGVLREVKTAYFELYALDRSIAVLREQKPSCRKRWSWPRRSMS